jgi:hypothetical protein
LACTPHSRIPDALLGSVTDDADYWMDAGLLRSAFACLLTTQGNLTDDLFHHRKLYERRDAIFRV